LNAFLAPLAAFLLRLFQPVLRVLLTTVLPAFLSFMDTAMAGLDDLKQLLGDAPRLIWNFVRRLPGLIWQAISAGASWLADGVASIGNAIWQAIASSGSWLASGIAEFAESIWDAGSGFVADIVAAVRSLPRQIAAAISRAVPSIPNVSRSPANDTGDAVGDGTQIQEGQFTRGEDQLSVILQSDVEQTVTQIERNGNVSLQP